MEKQRRDLQVQLDELKEDYDAERAARERTEKHRRELADVGVVLNSTILH